MRTGLYIDGLWETCGSAIKNHNPSDISDLICHCARASSDQLDAALHAANLEQNACWVAGILKRHDVPMANGTELRSRTEEIGRIIAREEGIYAAEFNTTVKTAYVTAGEPS